MKELINKLSVARPNLSRRQNYDLIFPMLITLLLQFDSKTTGKLETKSGILIFTIILGAGETRHTNMMKTYLLSF